MIDATGNLVKAGDEVFVSRHVHRGLDCACVGTVESISESGQTALVKITSDLKYLSETVKDHFEYYEFNDTIRVKYTKLIFKERG